MLEPVRYPRYYDDHPDQLSEKFKDQYDCDTGDFIFIGLVVIAVILAFIVG